MKVSEQSFKDEHKEIKSKECATNKKVVLKYIIGRWCDGSASCTYALNTRTLSYKHTHMGIHQNCVMDTDKTHTHRMICIAALQSN